MRVSLLFMGSLIILQTGIFSAIASPKKALTSIRGIDMKNVELINSETKRDGEIDKAIRAQLGEVSKSVRYYYNRVDLNSDRNPEIIAYVVSKHVCGKSGCPTMIFQKTAQGYKLISQTLVTNQPIIVTNTKTNGWQDIIFSTSGGGAKPNYWLVKFDGVRYPESPYLGKEVAANSVIQGKAYIADDITSNSGISLDISPT
ncbi:hypothetical protein [Brunnivagina elsteri]|uniref:Uncharacterized protein n=1 Tax=Brunnivagina elsteri CCALA 953 TaxID=987040 RepID=A0A2A2TEG6_9CYAN|nr:hypothetical protein [Calothrix elsteri]PAX52091.1 hypothetical protein CK510_21200 [Calothrix elsteri CCALA 953]